MLAERHSGVHIDPLNPWLKIRRTLLRLGNKDRGRIAQLLEIGQVPLFNELCHQAGAKFVEFE